MLRRMADLQNDAHATVYGSSIHQRHTLGGVHRLSGWRAVFENLERLRCGAGGSTPVRSERSRPWPVTEAAEAGDQTASPQAPEGGLASPSPASTKKARVERLSSMAHRHTGFHLGSLPLGHRLRALNVELFRRSWLARCFVSPRF